MTAGLTPPAPPTWFPPDADGAHIRVKPLREASRGRVAISLVFATGFAGLVAAGAGWDTEEAAIWAVGGFLVCFVGEGLWQGLLPRGDLPVVPASARPPERDGRSRGRRRLGSAIAAASSLAVAFVLLLAIDSDVGWAAGMFAGFAAWHVVAFILAGRWERINGRRLLVRVDDHDIDDPSLFAGREWLD